MAKISLLISAAVLFNSVCEGQEKSVDGQSVSEFIMSCRKPNGAFGPLNQNYTDLAWTYPAVHALRILNTRIDNDASAFANGHQSWMEKNPWKNGPWYWSFYQKAMLFKLYNKKDEFEEDVRFGQSWTLKYVPRKSYTEFRNYPRGEFFDMSSLSHMVVAIDALDGKVINPDYAKDYIIRRQAPGGGFVDDVRQDPEPEDAKAHIIISWDAIMTLTALGLPVPNRDACVAWIQSCQTSSGGFRWSPVSSDHSNKEDVWYTWAAVLALDALDARPKDVEGCVQWINSLQNGDGGFGDRPAWNSRLYSTYYAVHAFEVLTGNAREAIREKNRIINANAIPEGRYNIFQAQHKTPSGGTGMVDSLVMMKFNLVGVKSREMDTASETGVYASIERARGYAQHRDYALEILAAPENYSHKLRWMSGQRADHVSNFLVPPELSEEEVKIYKDAYQAGQKGLSWEKFKSAVIQPILALRSGNVFYPELDYTMINAYMVYDDGLDGKPGYNAVPAAHFGNIDWVRHFPYKERWEGVLPFIADGDAHGNMLKWYPNLLQYRNIYIAEHYDFDHYIDASKNGRSVCVIVMPDGEVRYYGAKPAIAYLKKHLKEWQWWESKQAVR